MDLRYGRSTSSSTSSTKVLMEDTVVVEKSNMTHTSEPTVENVVVTEPKQQYTSVDIMKVLLNLPSY